VGHTCVPVIVDLTQNENACSKDLHKIANFLRCEQLDTLATEAKIASVKLSWRSQDSEPK